MSEVFDFYQQQAKAGVSTIPWLAQLQAQALQELQQVGFPTRHHEDWKYTLVDKLLQLQFSLPEQPVVTKITRPDLPFERQLDIRNGQILGVETLAKTLPDGVIIQSLADALLQHPDKVQSYLAKAFDHQHGFQALNTALLRCGLLIYIPAGVQIEEPIVIRHWQDQANQAVHYRHLIIAEEESQATLIEEYSGLDNCCYFSNTITELFIAARAKIAHYKIQCEAKSAYHIGHLAVQQQEASQLDSHSLSLGGKLVRSDIQINLQEAKAQCLLNGIYAPADGQHVDHHTTVHHLVPNCQSNQDYKGILAGRSRAVFNGKVIVARDAQQTEARQQNKNILLSKQAEIDTKPQLEIFANDVICTHGATVGQLDEDALFYLATRGIDRAEASRYLIQAFAANNLRLVPDSKLADWMANLLIQQLG